jgi:hypothetical protein
MPVYEPRRAPRPCPAKRVGGDREGVACGQMCDAMGWHSVSCGVGGDRGFKHNQVRDVIYTACVTAQMGPSREVPNILEGGEKPGDVAITNFDGSRNAALDVTVVSPILEQDPHADTVRGTTAARAEQTKLDKYDLACRERGWLFIPIAVESYGTWGAHALKTLKKIVIMLAARTGRSRNIETRYFYERLSFALQKGNAHMLIARAPESTSFLPAR